MTSGRGTLLECLWPYVDFQLKLALVAAFYDQRKVQKRLYDLPITFSVEFALVNGDRLPIAQVYPWDAECILAQFTNVDLVVDTGYLHVIFAYIRTRFDTLYTKYGDHVRSVRVKGAWPARLEDEPWAHKLASLDGIPLARQAQFLNITELPNFTKAEFSEWAPPVDPDCLGYKHLRRLELRDVTNPLTLKLPQSLEEIVVVNSSLTITNTEPLPALKKVTWHQQNVGLLLKHCPNVTWLDTTDHCPQYTGPLMNKITHIAVNEPGTVPLEKFTNLAYLRFYGGSSYVRFMPAQVCQQLTALTLGCSPQEVLIFEHILFQFINLQRLVIDGFGIYFSPRTVKHDNLQKLVFHNCCFIEGKLTAQLPELREFHVSSTKSMVDNFCDMDQYSNLRKVVFADSDWSPQFMWSHPKVVDLSLQNMELHYGAFDGFPNLRRLHLDDNYFTSVQLTNPYLEEVSLAGNETLKTVILMLPHIKKVDVLGILEEASVFMAAKPQQIINGPLANLLISPLKQWQLPPVPALILDLTQLDPLDELLVSPRTIQVNVDLPDEWKEECPVYLSPYTHLMVTNVIPIDFSEFAHLTVVNLLTPNWGDIIQLPPTLRKLLIHDPTRKQVPQFVWELPADLEYLHLGQMEWLWLLIGLKHLPKLMFIRVQLGPEDDGPVPKTFLGYTWDAETVTMGKPITMA